MALQEKLMELLEPLVETLGYEIVLLQYNPHRTSASLQIYIDSPGGITLSDCERVSREVEGRLDVDDPIPQGYRLEVSSPGLDRPLVKPGHFERFAGSPAKIQLIAPLAGGSTQRKYLGTLAGLQGEDVLLATPDLGTVKIPLAQIERARLVPEFEGDRKSGPSSKSKSGQRQAGSASPNSQSRS